MFLPLFSFLLWRISLFIIALIAIKVVFLRQDFLGGGMAAYNNNPFLWSWANFDGVHYLSIAQNGYSQLQQAFFPLYPVAIRLLFPFTAQNYFLAGFIISYISFLLAMIFFYRLILIDYSPIIAEKVLIFLLFFPTSFFFGLVYNESLFLLLLISSFYFARRKKWLPSVLLAFLASTTRLIGIFLWPALIVEYWLQNKDRPRKNFFWPLMIILLPPLGLLAYMFYLDINYQDPLLFYHVQSQGWQRTNLVFPPQVVWRYFKIFWFTHGWNLGFYVAIQEFLSAILFGFLLILAFLKRIRKSYLVFALPAYLLPIFSGTFLSMPRFVVVLFPAFLLLGQTKNKILIFILIFIFSILLIFNTALFLRGWWVA